MGDDPRTPQCPPALQVSCGTSSALRGPSRGPRAVSGLYPTDPQYDMAMVAISPSQLVEQAG